MAAGLAQSGGYQPKRLGQLLDVSHFFSVWDGYSSALHIPTPKSAILMLISDVEGGVSVVRASSRSKEPRNTDLRRSRSVHEGAAVDDLLLQIRHCQVES